MFQDGKCAQCQGVGCLDCANTGWARLRLEGETAVDFAVRTGLTPKMYEAITRAILDGSLKFDGHGNALRGRRSDA